ncbi:hypothetical protein DH2020_000686 [Rehmannia glutinosa]|uniref:Pectinesterase inhibitor domain-containing protein n=1 Tax=Rehmannia glutinosa TaxID=99300 RepID=A0ABR0XX59_REHGL
MATFFPLYTSCSLLFLTTASIFLPTNNGALVDDVCRQTTDPPLCLNVYAFDPTIQNETLPTLAAIALQVAVLDANAIKIKLVALSNSTNDPKLKALYGQCEKLYVDAFAVLKAAVGDLRGRRYGAIKGKADRAIGDVGRCEAAFKNSSPVKKLSHELEVVAQALGVIAKSLSR